MENEIPYRWYKVGEKSQEMEQNLALIEEQVVERETECFDLLDESNEINRLKEHKGISTVSYETLKTENDNLFHTCLQSFANFDENFKVLQKKHDETIARMKKEMSDDIEEARKECSIYGLSKMREIALNLAKMNLFLPTDCNRVENYSDLYLNDLVLELFSYSEKQFIAKYLADQRSCLEMMNRFKLDLKVDGKLSIEAMLNSCQRQIVEQLKLRVQRYAQYFQYSQEVERKL